jgi:membrane protein
MFEALRLPVGWRDLSRRTYREAIADNCLGLAAQLAYYFFLALFPALLFLVALLSYVPVGNLMATITDALSRVAPGEVLTLVEGQILEIAKNEKNGLLTFGMVGTIWSTSAGISAIIDALNQAYDIRESRPWWRVKLLALGLTMALATFIALSTAVVVAGPALTARAASWFGLGSMFTQAWSVLQWPLVFALVSLAIALIYYFGPDAEQEWIWITPGSILATVLWILASLGFRFYVTNFGSYNATYGTLGGIIVVLLWFYVSALAILVGAELNAEIEHASPHGKDPGERVPGEKRMLGALAARAWRDRRQMGLFKPALTAANCEIDKDLPPASAQRQAPPRPSDWILSGLVLGKTALTAYGRLKSHFPKRPIRG